MARNVPHPESATRRQILRAALKSFAERGYAASSVQDIVDAARVSKPALYYYFADKGELFRALVEAAHDERYELMRAAAARARGLRPRLVGILTDLFRYLRENRQMMRLSFATAFAADHELPRGLRCLERTRRNFEFIHELMKAGQRAGELDARFDPGELAFGFYGQINTYLMSQLVMPRLVRDRRAAARIVDLFLAGAALKRNGARAANHSPAPKTHRPVNGR